MLKIALTGGIATGKTYVLRRLAERGVAVIDADDLVHELMAPKTPMTQAVALEFGSGVLQPGGGVDRTVLATKVFSNPRARLRLEAIVHPPVYAAIRRWLADGDRPIAVVSIPLLYETEREADFDLVVATACTPEQQRARLMARGLSEEEARLRMAAQLPAEAKALRADYVIRTSGTELETNAQVDELVAKLTRRIA